jgi:uncharacterized lipoprotein YmbA
MRHLRGLRFAVALCATLAAASCASPDPKLYTIAPVSGAELSGAPKIIAVHGVGVAQYLQRSPVVQSSADYRVVLRANSWWGEPVDAMLGRVLAEDLTQRLPQSTIYTPASTVAASPDATVQLEVQRLDLDGDGNLILIAQGSVTFKNRASPDTRRFRMAQPPPSPGVEGQVAATSTVLAQVADRLASMLTIAPGRKDSAEHGGGTGKSGGGGPPRVSRLRSVPDRARALAGHNGALRALWNHTPEDATAPA